MDSQFSVNFSWNLRSFKFNVSSKRTIYQIKISVIQAHRHLEKKFRIHATRGCTIRIRSVRRLVLVFISNSENQIRISEGMHDGACCKLGFTSTYFNRGINHNANYKPSIMQLTIWHLYSVCKNSIWRYITKTSVVRYDFNLEYHLMRRVMQVSGFN